MPDIDFDELDRAVHDLMRQSGQLPTTPDKPSEAPATTPSKDSASSSTQTATPQQTIAADSARPEESDDTQDASTLRTQDNTNSTDETVQTDDSTTVTDATSDTNTDSMPVRRRGVTIMPLSQQADEAEPAGESYEPVEPEPAVDRARALSESVVASEREPASMPANLEQTDAVDDAESIQATSVDTATPMQTTTDDMPSQSQPAAVVTVDPDDIITPASDDDDEDDDAYTDRAQFFGRSAARPFVASPAREATPVDDVASVAHSDTPASAAETDNVASSISSDNVASEETSAAATEEETPATIEQVESETPTMPYQFAGEDAESDDDDDEALVRHLNEVNRTQDDETEPVQASVVDDLDDAFAPQPLIIPPPTEKTDDTPLSSVETAVQPADDAYTANDVPVAAPQDEPDNTTSVSDTDDANDDQLLYAPATSADTDISGVPNSSDIPDNEIVQSLGQQHEETAWPELQYDEPDNIPGVQASDVDHATPAWPEVATDSTSVADDGQTAAQVADADVLSEHVSFGDEGMPWQDELAASSTQSHVDDVAPAELLTAERTIPDAAVANDNPSPQPEEMRTEDAMPEAHIDRPLPLLSTYNEHRATPEPYLDTSLPDSQEEANAIDAADVDQNTNDTVQNTVAMQLSDTPDGQPEQLYAPTTPLFAPADDVVAKAQQIIAAHPETSTNDTPTSPQKEEDMPENAPEVVPITLSRPADQQTEPSVADASAMHTADETASTEPSDDQAAAPSIQRPRGRFMDIVGGAAPAAVAAQTARPRVRRQGAVVEPLTSSAPVVGMDIRPAPGHEPAQHHAGAASITPSASDEAKASDVATPDGAPSADALDLQPGDEKPLSYTPFLPDAETKVDKRPLGGADTLVGDAPTLADTTPMGMYHDEPDAFGIAPADTNEPSIPQHLFAPHDEHASAEQFIDALTDTSENAPSLYPTDDHYPLPEQGSLEAVEPHDESSYQLEDHYGADQSFYPDEPADSREASADRAGPQFAEDEIDLSLPVPGPGEPDIDYYGETERVEAEPMTVETEWDDEPTASDQAHVNTIEEAAATTQNGDTALALHQALQEENEGNVVAPIYSAEEFTRAPKKSRRRPEQAAGWIWLLWIVMLLALGAGLGAVYYTLFT